MSVGKSVYLAIGVLFSAFVLFGCEGDQGSQGPNGFEGPTGPPGNNYSPAPVARQNFGLMVTNSTVGDFNGAAKVEITSDANASPAADRVVARLLTKAPTIDGIDGGAQEWGNAPVSNIALSNLFGADNGISTAKVRFGYDRNYVYALISWTETTAGEFAIGADTAKEMWNYTEGNWSRLGGEDKLYLAWEITAITGWDADGIAAIFDGSSFKTSNDSGRADLWVWQSTESYHADLVSDNVVVFAADNGLQRDLGAPAVLVNDAVGGTPRYMRSNSPKAGTSYPLLAFEYTAFEPGLGWFSGATIPGYITMVPAGSTADIQSIATFFSDTWIVELRRLRNTGYADDLGL